MKKIPVFYNPKMAVLEQQPSPSAQKPKLLVEQWLERGFDIEVIDFEPITREDFYTVHDKSHVDDILDVKKPNGMDTLSQELADSLYWTNASLLKAAEHALKHQIAVSPTSGFHHAEYSEAMGYCTFNGLMVTAQNLLKNRKVKKVGILDCDQHYGNGTENIINEYCMEDKITHITARKSYHPEPKYAFDFFERLPFFLEDFSDCGLLIYQAGADCHIDDPCGGFLTSKEMSERDRQVFNFCKEKRIPLVWNLAGGYQEENIGGIVSIQKVLDLHHATMQECIRAYL